VLDAQLGKRRGEFTLDVAFQARAGDTTVLVGESGAGKTSVLRLLTGLDRLDEGRVLLDGTALADGGVGVHVPAWQRSIGYVAQDYALFPHLSVRENVAFGLRADGVPARRVTPAVMAALELVGIATLADRLPHQLSGGQQQRAALARALVLEPRLLLLDEPLSSLDIQTRRALRVELRALLQRLPCVTVYVTHSPIEALVFGDQVVVLDGGRVAQAGSRGELLRYPRSPFVAELVGTNLFIGRATEGPPNGGALGGPVLIRTPEGAVAIDDTGAPGAVYLTVSPREIMLSRTLPQGSPQNVFAGPVLELIPEPPGGERVRVVLATQPPLVAEVTREAVASLALTEGMPVYAAFKATGVHRYT
jgi:molybdate transport system ATP-binding protein